MLVRHSADSRRDVTPVSEKHGVRVTLPNCGPTIVDHHELVEMGKTFLMCSCQASFACDKADHQSVQKHTHQHVLDAFNEHLRTANYSLVPVNGDAVHVIDMKHPRKNEMGVVVATGMHTLFVRFADASEALLLSFDQVRKGSR